MKAQRIIWVVVGVVGVIGGCARDLGRDQAKRVISKHLNSIAPGIKDRVSVSEILLPSDAERDVHFHLVRPPGPDRARADSTIDFSVIFQKSDKGWSLVRYGNQAFKDEVAYLVAGEELAKYGVLPAVVDSLKAIWFAVSSEPTGAPAVSLSGRGPMKELSIKEEVQQRAGGVVNLPRVGWKIVGSAEEGTIVVAFSTIDTTVQCGERVSAAKSGRVEFDWLDGFNVTCRGYGPLAYSWDRTREFVLKTIASNGGLLPLSSLNRCDVLSKYYEPAPPCSWVPRVRPDS